MDARCLLAFSASYGHISAWETGGVTDMQSLFDIVLNSAASSFNDDISAWDTSGVTMMNWMFYEASAFNQPLGDWNVAKVKNMGYMFHNAKRFNQDLGWCMTANVDRAFDGTRCESTLCGVETGAFGTCDEGIQAVFISGIVWACLVVLYYIITHWLNVDWNNLILILLPFLLVLSCHELFCWFWWVSKNDNKREVLREAYKENNRIQSLLIILIILPFLPFISCIYLFWWLVTKAGESCKVTPAAIDAAPATSEEPSALATSEEPALPMGTVEAVTAPTAEEQAPAVPMGTVEAVHEGGEQAVPMGTVEAVHEGESPVPYATVLSVEQ